MLGPINGENDLSAADARLVGEEVEDLAGHTVSGAGDVNGDGRGDVLIGAHGHDTGGGLAGAAYLVLGPINGATALSDADVRFVGEAANDHAGSALSSAGDVDGDGLDEFLIGAYGNDTGGSTAGAAYLLRYQDL